MKKKNQINQANAVSFQFIEKALNMFFAIVGTLVVSTLTFVVFYAIATGAL